MILHAALLFVRGGRDVEHVFDPVGAVGDLNLPPVVVGVLEPADNDWWEIQVPDGTDWIEYMLNIPSNADHKERGIQNHFSFAVEQIEPSVALLRAHGLKTTAEPEIGRDGKWSFDICDPDLTRVEFMEFKPAQPPCCNPYTASHPVQ